MNVLQIKKKTELDFCILSRFNLGLYLMWYRIRIKIRNEDKLLKNFWFLLIGYGNVLMLNNVADFSEKNLCAKESAVLLMNE